MSSASRALFRLLALSLSLVSPALAQSQSVPNQPASSAESAVRAVAEKYFALYSAEDLGAVSGLWSEKSPDYASLKQNLQRQFATEDLSFSVPVISRVKVEAEKASLRAITNLTAINLKSSQKREQRVVHNFAFVSEDGKWKVWRSAPAEEDLAEALLKAKTEAERTELLAGEKELVTGDLVRALNNQGDRFSNQGEHPQAMRVYTLANSLAEQIGDRSEIARTRHNLGHVHRLQGNFAQAMENFRKGLAINEALGKQEGIARSLLGIGMVHWLQGDFTQALVDYRKSLAIFEALNNNISFATVLNNIGNIHRDQGDYVQALEYYRKSLKIRQELKDTAGILASLGNIGVVYSSQGNYGQALDYYQKSLAMSEAENDKEGIAITLGNIGVIHRKQGNYAQALDYYQKSLAMSEAIYDKVGIALMVNNIGTVHLFQRNYGQAMDYYQKSLAMREESGDKHGISHTLMAIGIIHAAQGSYAQAWEYYQKSMAIKEAIKDRGGITNLLLHIGIYHKNQGHDSQALDFAERAATLARQDGNLYLLWSARVNAGLAYRALNQLDKARLAFEEAIAVIETMRGQVAGSEQEQQRFFEDKISPYYAMADLLVAENNPTEALIFIERARARALLDLLYSGRVNVVKAMTSQEQERERTLRAEIISLNTQVTRASKQARPDQARLSELTSQREKARLNYEAFQILLYAAHPELRVQRGEAQVIKAGEIAALAPDDRSALLEYVITDDKTFLFAITKATGKAEAVVRVYTLPVKRADLAKQIDAFRGQLAARDLAFRASAIKLYNLLFKPAEAQLRAKTNLIIAPDDTLWDLPFQALVTGTDRFLIEEAAIAYAPSLTVLREMMRRPKNRGADAASATLLALGNPMPGKETINRAAMTVRDGKLEPLPEAEQEVKALRQLYGTSRSKVYVGAEAREDRVKSEAGQARILHFATHGMLNNASPMYSHLALAEGGANEDGLLEAWELTQLDLKADLAVLSACETARGRIGAGEGMIGLSWAMFIAGVPSIVVSQWKVESAATRDLMVSFHRALISEPLAGKAKPTKTEALRQAALKLMKSPETRHPFYWAGFVLVGYGR
jgi:CHAT domain-containing protein/tetratricopeptide (TPR) repeat protein